MKVVRSLWETGASVSLISARVTKVLGLVSIGKSGVSGYNEGIDVKDTYCVHVGLPTGDIVTNIIAMEFDSDEYDVVIGMDVIGKGDLAVTNLNDRTTFTFRIPSFTIRRADSLPPCSLPSLYMSVKALSMALPISSPKT